MSLLIAALLALSCGFLNGQSATVLHTFTNSPDGGQPYAGLLINGAHLYGTAREGGANSVGIVFSMNSDGSGFTVLHDFSSAGADGYYPYGGLVLVGDTLYGTTAAGGTNVPPGGIIFSIKTNGTGYSILHEFSVADGQFPHGRLLVSGNTLYGTTLGAGSTGWGSVFSMNNDGSAFTVLHTFSSPIHNDQSLLTNWDGEQPWAGVVLAGQTLYGTTHGGGVAGYGTVYSVNTDGSDFTVLHTFTNAPDGALPQGGVLLSGDTLFGTTEKGGSQTNGALYALNTNGTAFAVLHSFTDSGGDGSDPWAELIMFSSRLHGATSRGGVTNRGTLFSLNPDGSAYAVLYSFTNNPDGAAPETGLVASQTALYGTTVSGGIGLGTVFSFPLVPPTPIITRLSSSGSDLLLSVSNGAAGHSYVLLGNSIPLSPLLEWTPLVTNVLTAPGDFGFVLPNGFASGSHQQFFRVKAQ